MQLGSSQAFAQTMRGKSDHVGSHAADNVRDLQMKIKL